MKTHVILASIVALFLSGCATQKARIYANNTAFFIDGYIPEGTISVVAANKDINNSLAFAFYKKKFEEKLVSNGYVIEQSPSKAKYIAFVAYGIDNGVVGIVSTPVFGQTGGGSTHSSGTLYGSSGITSYSGTSYTMPTYGVVGTSTRSVRSYTRAIALDIVDTASLKSGSLRKIYEGRTKSAGRCPEMVEVFDEMLSIMFHEFPGFNGRNMRLVVSGEANC